VTSDAASVQGAWSFEEEVQLLRALEELKREGKSNQSAREDSGFLFQKRWEIPGHRRNKWCVLWCSSFIIITVMSFSGEKTIKSKITVGNEGKTRRWKDVAQDSCILICKCVA